MIGGFFHRTELPTVRRTAFQPECGKCKLDLGCRSPKMPVAGRGAKKILIVGEAPGAQEDEANKPFVGQSGQRLQQALRANGIELFRDCWVTNAAACRPPDNKLPPKAVDYCRPLVLRAIEELKPRVILLVGGTAVRSVIGHLWRDDPGGIFVWDGFRIPSRRWNAWVCPVLHPSFLNRMDSPVLERAFDANVRAAVRIERRPLRPNDPDLGQAQLSDRIATWMDPDFTDFLEPIISKRLIAFDYETTTLKPDGPDAEIVCCSVSNGYVGVAFPWAGNVRRAFLKILADPTIRKIGQNLKFEHRWTLAKEGVNVRGWVWDDMTTAHAMDARPGITSIKFQAFVRLGVEDWAAGVSPFLRSKGGGNAPNRVREVPMDVLLRYCAFDSLYEFMVAERQAKELGVEL